MNNELDLQEMFTIFKKKWKIILIITTLLSLAAFFFSSKLPSVYEARMDLLVNYTVNEEAEEVGIQSSDLELSRQLIETYKEIIQSCILQVKSLERCNEKFRTLPALILM